MQRRRNLRSSPLARTRGRSTTPRIIMAELVFQPDRIALKAKAFAPHVRLRAAMRKVLLVILAMLLSSCGKLNEITDPGNGSGGGQAPPDPAATFSRVQSQVFAPTCAVVGCHDRIARQQGLQLTSDVSYANIVGRPSTEVPSLSRVAPGDPENSYLYRKLTGVGITGDRMPQGGPFLSASDLALVRDWIRRGAPND